MTILNSIKMMALAAAVTPLIFMFYFADPALMTDKGFNQIMSWGLGLAIFLGLFGPHLFMYWMFDRPLRQIRDFCIRVKRGEYTEFTDLPNEAVYQENENEFVTLKRDLNWMARQIKTRECELGKTIAELKVAKEILLVQKRRLTETNLRLTEMAMTDFLTGLSNRRHFFEHLEQEILRSQRGRRALSLFLLDIDHFKRINDQHGHQYGDRVLVEFAAVLRNNLEKSALTARVGGEEFAVLLADVGCRESLLIANRLHRAIQNHRFLACKGQSLKVTCSIGICSVENSGLIETHLLYQMVDDALYAAKRGGRNCIKHCVYGGREDSELKGKAKGV